MPVDDLLVWAAETSRSNSRRPSTNDSNRSDEPESCTEYGPTMHQPPSPSPKRNRQPKWYDIGHCAVACSGRCSLHAARQEQTDLVNNGDASLPGVAEALQTQRRSHRRDGRPSSQGNDSQNLRVSSGSISKGSEGRKRTSPLDQARQALLNGNVTAARTIVAAELERLNNTEVK